MKIQDYNKMGVVKSMCILALIPIFLIENPISEDLVLFLLGVFAILVV